LVYFFDLITLFLSFKVQMSFNKNNIFKIVYKWLRNEYDKFNFNRSINYYRWIFQTEIVFKCQIAHKIDVK